MWTAFQSCRDEWQIVGFGDEIKEDHVLRNEAATRQKMNFFSEKIRRTVLLDRRDVKRERLLPRFGLTVHEGDGRDELVDEDAVTNGRVRARFTFSLACC